jgi:hypothetical protein
MHSPDPDVVATALSRLRDMLAADGYDMTVRLTGPAELRIDIGAGPDACAECLVPKNVIASIAMDALAGNT